MKFFKFNDESKDDSIESLALYYANGNITNKEFKDAKKQLTLENFKEMITKCNSEVLSMNTLKSQEKMRKDMRATGYAPIGYKNIIRKNGQYDVVIDKDIASNIRSLFNIFVTGLIGINGLGDIARDFGLKGKISKKPISNQAIIYILSNPFYCGYARHKGNWYEHKYERIISEDLFFKCYELLVRKGIIK